MPSLRPPYLPVAASSASSSSSHLSPSLLARVAEKKAELEKLQRLRDLTAAVAGQMEALAAQLATLSDGTEAIAAVMSNWPSVMAVVNMASVAGATLVGGPAPPEPVLPQTLVRIPTEHSPAMQLYADAVADVAAAAEDADATTVAVDT